MLRRIQNLSSMTRGRNETLMTTIGDRATEMALVWTRPSESWKYRLPTDCSGMHGELGPALGHGRLETLYGKGQTESWTHGVG